MEAAIAFVGIGLGWLLAEISERRRRGADGKVAASLVLFELLQARELLKTATEQKGLLPHQPATLAWQTYAPNLLRWKPESLAVPMMIAYNGITTDSAMLQFLRSESDNALGEIKALNGGQDESEYADSTQADRDRFSNRVHLLVKRQQTLRSNLDGYLLSISENTLPAIDAAVAVLERHSHLPDGSPQR